jgi:hypothetical protein
MGGMNQPAGKRTCCLAWYLLIIVYTGMILYDASTHHFCVLRVMSLGLWIAIMGRLVRSLERERGASALSNRENRAGNNTIEC